MRLVVTGEAEETEESVQSLLLAFAAAAVRIYLLLALLFNSARNRKIAIFRFLHFQRLTAVENDRASCPAGSAE
jgi:multidrug efflux pump subunit AcrB